MEWKRGLVMLMAALALGALGCGDDDGGGDGDAGGGTDSGPPGGDDTGPPGGDDTGPPGGDDSGPPSGMDSGPPAGDDCPAMFAGCATFEDMTGGGARDIMIMGFAYDPQCIRVNVGQTVNVPAAIIHPVNGACGPGGVNPIVDGATMNQAVTFDTPGIYGFNCMNHGAPDGTGMAGAIEVVP